MCARIVLLHENNDSNRVNWTKQVALVVWARLAAPQANTVQWRRPNESDKDDYGDDYDTNVTFNQSPSFAFGVGRETGSARGRGRGVWNWTRMRSRGRYKKNIYLGIYHNYLTSCLALLSIKPPQSLWVPFRLTLL